MCCAKTITSKPDPLLSRPATEQITHIRCGNLIQFPKNEFVLTYPKVIDESPADIERRFCQNKINFVPNAGGRSTKSESASAGMLKQWFGFELLQTELEVNYSYDCNNVVHVDFTGLIEQKLTAVSVTRISKTLLTCTSIKQPSFEEIKERLLHKCYGFNNIDYEYLTKKFKTLTQYTQIDFEEFVTHNINIIFIFVEPCMMDMFYKVIESEDLAQQIIKQHIYVIAVPTDSAFLMYEHPNMDMEHNVSVDEYVTCYIDKLGRGRQHKERTRILNQIIKQSNRYEEMVEAIAVAKKHITRQVPRHVAKEIFKKERKCDLFTWTFRKTNPDGIFNGYYISTLMYFRSFMKEMSSIVVDDSEGLLETLKRYYNKRTGKFDVVYVKGQYFDKDGNIVLTGTLSLVKRDKTAKKTRSK